MSKIVVVTRCLNGEKHIERFLYGYSFADLIIVSDGGSTDGSIKLLKGNEKVKLLYFDEKIYYGDGLHYNPDASHLNYVINAGKGYEPQWMILDDLDDVPNYLLRENARHLLQDVVVEPQANVYRLYMWGEDKWFPNMNGGFRPDYSSLWAWMPDKVNIYADGEIIPDIKTHFTVEGLSNRFAKLVPPYCCLHYSWDDESIKEKTIRYKAMGIPFQHPFEMKNAGTPVDIPEWARP